MIWVMRLWPYALAAVIGGSAAWSIQGIRLDSAKAKTVEVQQSFDTYKIEQKRLAYESAESARKQREQSERDWSKKHAKLQKDTEIFKRCVAAGKCGPGWMSYLPGTPAITKPGLSPPKRLDALSPDPVSSAGESAPPVIAECAVTTLMLNELQRGVEGQPGY